MTVSAAAERPHLPCSFPTRPVGWEVGAAVVLLLNRRPPALGTGGGIKLRGGARVGCAGGRAAFTHGCLLGEAQLITFVGGWTNPHRNYCVVLLLRNWPSAFSTGQTFSTVHLRVIFLTGLFFWL